MGALFARCAILGMAGGGGLLGRGGMRTKIIAAQRAARSGAATLIASGRTDNVLLEIAKGGEIGTLLSPKTEKLAARKQWLAGHTIHERAARVAGDAVLAEQRLRKSVACARR